MAEATQYLTVTDLYPQEYKDSTMMYPFYDSLREDKNLTTTQCNHCGKVCWPPRIVCPECMSDDLAWVDMPKEGKIYTYTVQEAGLAPGFKPPLVFAVIEFENGIRIFSALKDVKPEEVKTGLNVVLSIGKIPPDQQGRERIIPYFTLKR